jgi:hypothetical protein
MPTIKDFGSFRLSIYFEDHNPPHVHVITAEFHALVAIQNAEVIRGNIPAPHRKRALKWIAEHRSELIRRWNECRYES